jgi:glutathione S-transferase
VLELLFKIVINIQSALLEQPTNMSKPILFHTPQARSTRVAWYLYEINADVEIKKVDLFKGEQKSPEFLKINPNGVVPAYIEGDKTIVESAAIVLYLADKYSKLIPNDKAKFYQWIVYSVASCKYVSKVLILF